MQKVYIDVGCNRGQNAFSWLNDPNALVYAFEPNPALHQYLKQYESDRFKVFDYAIGTDEGVKPFNIGENDATSSLKNFDSSVTAFRYSETIYVKVISLDTFCKEYNIHSIHLLKIDAQGSDLDVLHSLGDFVNNVQNIIVEAFIEEDVNVYEDEVKESQVMSYLTPKGFVLSRRVVDGNYCDLYFVKN
jgi:FkbM family methyltransferase